jgi:signal transduction histidine kinase
MSRRILLAMLAVTVLAVAIFAVPLAVSVRRLYRNETVLRLEREATQATTQVPASFAGGREEPELPPAQPGTRLALYDRAGNVVIGEGPAQLDPALTGALIGRVSQGWEGELAVVAVPVSSEERVVGVVRAAATADEDIDRAEMAWLLMALLALVAVGIAAAVASWQARRLSRPVAALAGAAVRLGQGDFTSRAGRSGVAEVDAVAQALDSTAERLGQLLARERAFSADASHQLRTPLAGLRLRLEAAQVIPGADRDKAIADALLEADRLEATVEALLLLARDQAPDSEPLDTTALLGEIEAAWHEPLAAAGRPLRILAEPDLPTVRASATAISQALTVLVGNAAEHGSGTVTVAARNAPRGLVIEVRDQGQGIIGDPARLFDRRTGTTPGRGIGLALARSLVEAEGGRLLLTGVRPAAFALVLPSESPVGPVGSEG